MSRATLYVRFPDATLRYGLYNGTADYACRPLYASPAEAWDAYDLTGGVDDPTAGEVVDIATDYAGGSSWPGTATRHELTSGFDPDEAADYFDGLPGWAVNPRTHGETR